MNQSTTPKRRGLPRWAWIVVALLVAHTSAMLAAVAVAVDDPSFTTVPDYYQQALRWDDVQERRRASEHLGWTATIEPSALGDRLVVELVDRDELAVTGARGALTAYHHAGANDVRTVALAERGAGIYFAPLDVSRAGAWQVTLEVQRREGEDFFEESEVVVRADGGAR